MKKIIISCVILLAIPFYAEAVAPTVSINSPGPGTYSGAIPVYATASGVDMENYHFRVIKDGGAQGHTCTALGALFAPENQGYASTTLNKDTCGFNFNQSVYISGSGFTNSLITTLRTDDLIAFGGEGDYWLILGARDTAGNRSASNYLDDPKVKITISKTGPAIVTVTPTRAPTPSYAPMSSGHSRDVVLVSVSESNLPRSKSQTSNTPASNTPSFSKLATKDNIAYLTDNLADNLVTKNLVTQNGNSTTSASSTEMTKEDSINADNQNKNLAAAGVLKSNIKWWTWVIIALAVLIAIYVAFRKKSKENSGVFR